MNLAQILETYRKPLIAEWVRRLQTEVSPRYSRRPTEELFQTVSRVYEANLAVVLDNDFSQIDAHIEWITRLRLEGGFSLSEVQNAYDLYRQVLTPLLVQRLTKGEIAAALKKIDACLLYTIKRFSNFYQSLHEKGIREHAENLKREVKKRTQELSESEGKYRILVEEINDGYFVNQRGRIVFANRAFADLHGYLPEEVVGKSYIDFVAEESRSQVETLYRERMSGRETADLYVYLRRHRNGQTLPTENKVKRILFRDEKAVAGICRDITERIETERRIRESERLAHIGRLTTSLAHEIRNPLSSVKLNSQIILKNMKCGGNDQRRLEIIVQEISRLERILEEMLDFARPVGLNLKKASLNAMLDACLEIIEARVKEKALSVIKAYARRLPRIPLDREKMEQALINIFLNALEALPSGGRIEVATTSLLLPHRALQVDIRDDGQGFNPEDLPFVFNPFFTNKKKGTGLGLFNVKKVIEAHGGNVEIVLGEPRGTRVRLTIPFPDKP
jgi:PAS domain S-box-containing protein